MRVVLTGGGTGGHVMPLAPITESLRVQYAALKPQLPRWVEPDRLDIYFLGVAGGQEKEFFQRFGVPVIHISSGKMRRYKSWLNFIDLTVWLPLGIIWALMYMWRIMPDVVVSKGGYGSIPVAVAAVFYRIPMILHESDAVAGVANRWLGKRATAVALGFEEAKTSFDVDKGKVFVTGTPVREEFDKLTYREARAQFAIPDKTKVLLVVGGSQGAAQINEVLLGVLPELVQEVLVIHVTGQRHFEKIKAVAEEMLAVSSQRGSYRAYPYLKDAMPQVMMAADVVVSRAGATVLAELTRLRKPMLLVPLPGSANDHQILNARVYEQHGAARVLDPANVNRALFLRNVRDLLSDEELGRQLSDNLARLDNPRAATLIAQLALQLATGIYPKQEL